MSCCVLSPQEERIIYHGATSPRERTSRLLKNFRDVKPRIDIQRAVLFTESMKETEAYPLNLRWAKALKHICENIDVVIQDNELIVGTCGGPGRYSILYPELRAGWYEKGLPDTQKKDAYTISDEAVAEIMEKVVPYWKGRTSHEMYLAIMDPETRSIIYGDDDYGSTGMMQDNSNVSSTLNWPGNYDYVIANGLNAIKEEAQRRLADIEDNLRGEEYDKVAYLQAEIETCEAMEILANRYAAKHVKWPPWKRILCVSGSWSRLLQTATGFLCMRPGHSGKAFSVSGLCKWAINLSSKLPAALAPGVSINTCILFIRRGSKMVR